jgi:hypothetical protein
MWAVAVAGQVALAVALVGLGLWGTSRSSRLPPSALGEDERRRRARTLARGAWVCVGLGGLFAVSTLIALLGG